LNILKVTSKFNSIFLATILVAGMIAAISPSIMTNAQAFQMDNNYVKKSHGKDVSVTSIKNTGGLVSSNINTDLSASNINTGGLASSFSSPPTIAQGTEDMSALEKIEKLKKQWLELLP
jgi:hypothetical protein